MTDLNEIPGASQLNMPVKVEDRDTHELLVEVIEGLRLLSSGTAGGKVDATGLARDESLSRVISQLSLLAEALEDIASRPMPAPQVEVRPQPLPPEIVQALIRLSTLELPNRLEFDDKLLEAVKAIRPAVSVQGGVGTVGLQKVLDDSKAFLASIDASNDAIAATIGATVAQKTEIDYFTEPNTGTKKERYIGKADQGTARSVAEWQVQKITYDTDGDPTKIEVLTDVGFSDPDNLSWEA